jgi:hypothetical protein
VSRPGPRAFTAEQEAEIIRLGRSGDPFDDATGVPFGCRRSPVRAAWKRLATFDDLEARQAALEQKLRRYYPQEGKLIAPKPEIDFGGQTFPDDPRAIEADRIGRPPQSPEPSLQRGTSLGW